MSRGTRAIAIVGAGALARALVSALQGGALVVAARRPAAARAQARGRRGVRAEPLGPSALNGAGLIVIAVDDRAIAPVARELAPGRRSWKGVVVLHAAAALGVGELRPFAARGAATGVLHPLATLGRGGAAALRGALARIEGSKRARAAAARLARRLGMRPYDAPVARGLYHAAAALASNDVTALLAAAQEAFERAGLPRLEARRGVAALARGTLQQFAASGASGALTGPVARGDAARVARHLEVLRRFDPAASEAHRALAARLLRVARAAKRISAEDAAALARVLAAPPRGRLRSRTV